MDKKSLRKFIPRTRRARLAVFVVAAVLGGAIAWRLAWYEPGYDGTSLSGWLREFQNEKVERRLSAAEAVRHIGPRAVPYLVERLGKPSSTEKGRLGRWRLRIVEWLGAHTSLNVSTWRNPNARLQALAALDALGPDAKEALPALEKLQEQNPAEIDILFAVARLGEAGVPFLQQSLTNSAPKESQTIRLAARVCLEMMKARSYALHPELAPDPASSEYLARCAKFHLAMTQAALSDYQAQHPELGASNNITDTPSPSAPSPLPAFDPQPAK